MNFSINFDIFQIIRQLTNLSLPLSGIADIFRSFWAYVRDLLRIFGL